MVIEKISTQLGGKEVMIETGKLAKQADGSVTIQCGGTMVLVTCCCARSAREKMSFFPLTVEYQEKTYAAGRIPGGFFKREGRPTEKEILTSRMIDRPIRPLFPEGMLNDVQVVATVLSSDGKNDSDILAIIGTSAALTISDIPFNGPIGGARVGLINDEFVVNPTFEEMEESVLDLIVVANEKGVVMLEAGADKIAEAKVIEGIKKAQEAIKPVIEMQKELQKKIGRAKREDITVSQKNEEIFQKVKDSSFDELKTICQISGKQDRTEKRKELKARLIETLTTEENEGTIQSDLGDALEALEKEILRDVVLNEKKRIDGRKFDEIRPLSSEINLLPNTHGSGLFTRGETQALAAITLGTSADEQRIETLKGQGVKSFMLHYNFPPFSVGETRPMRGPGRREIGHGALAEKALKAVLPSSEEFPYTIRLVSEILESNGSSSMATVCAGSLSLMGSGVPIKDAVSGIAMGLVKGDNGYAILTDIAGAEDHFGDMDFKSAGTKDGVTAVQMDLKVQGISYELLEEAFAQAKKARMEILDHMNKTVDKPSEDIAAHAPRIVSVKLPTDKIGGVIGPGGKMIRKIIADTGADINIDDDGICQIASADKESLDKALEWVKGLIAEPEVGKIYDAKIVKIMNFGAFCEYMPGKEGLVHVSELSNEYVKDAASCVKEGQEVKVKLIGIDDQGRVKLSIKQAEEKK
ncbi:MAG: polyribonucleotide nucleotidyltransferase [Candidatus Omnitrophica bacterium]|nr:polyribonucleotide nucleotidyltransferase [Candidatus Omnitrophota bacterium]